MPPDNCSDSSPLPALACGRWTEDGLKVDVRVQTRAGAKKVAGLENGRLKLRLTAAPVDGKANDQARGLLADMFDVAASRVELITGAKHRNKTFLVRAPARIPPELLAS